MRTRIKIPKQLRVAVRNLEQIVPDELGHLIIRGVPEIWVDSDGHCHDTSGVRRFPAKMPLSAMTHYMSREQAEKALKLIYDYEPAYFFVHDNGDVTL